MTLRNVTIDGGTDDTPIGNVGDSLNTNVTASALPTGAATAAAQASQLTSLQILDNVIGPVTPGAVATNSSLVGGQYNSSAPVLTNTQQAALQLNAAGALLVDGSQSTGTSSINRTDVSTTVSASGNSGTLDTQGLSALSSRIAVTAISGVGASIIVSIQRSDDGTNWDTFHNAPKLTATGADVCSSLRAPHRYYRYSWVVTGTLPSITLSVVTTLKSVQVKRHVRRFFYSDIDLSTLGAQSSVFTADDCPNIAVSYQRGADGGNNGTVQLFGSIDQINWFSLSGNLAANVSSSNSASLSNQAWPYYVLQVTAKTNVGTRTLDIQWSCN